MSCVEAPAFLPLHRELPGGGGSPWKGIYKTTDEGQTWTHNWPQSGSAPTLGISVLAIDPARPTTIYASAYNPSGRDATGLIALT
jgi:hypothetical protein